MNRAIRMMPCWTPSKPVEERKSYVVNVSVGSEADESRCYTFWTTIAERQGSGSDHENREANLREKTNVEVDDTINLPHD